ncbi:unnamed protein product [Porites evermanni]|uniref:Uncharacterized protein n=1 Tax=Porites evermanni TaxID=104178 RepID=A0ABN8LU16_9CNID|nr:unnamed protein product [Porites evermanni]
MLFRSKNNFSVDTFLADLECLPWSTMDMYSEPNEALTAIATRNHLHRKAILTNDALNWREYRSARNRVVHLIRYAKRSFYRNSINNNLENPKNLWRIIRSLAPSKCSKLPDHLTIDGMSYHDYYDIANFFNEHFANISSSVQLNHASDPPNWERIAYYVYSPYL